MGILEFEALMGKYRNDILFHTLVDKFRSYSQIIDAQGILLPGETTALRIPNSFLISALELALELRSQNIQNEIEK